MSMLPFHIEGYRASRIETCTLNVTGYERMFTFPKESLGDFVSTGDISHDYFTSETDGDPVVLTYNNFIVNEGHLVIPTNRCKGLYLNILGDLTISGTLSMTARGASAEGRYVGIHKGSRMIYYATEDIYKDVSGFEVIAATGGLGLAGPRNSPGIDGACGSGGGNGSGTSGARGGNGTSFSGGAGAGGGCSYAVGSSSYVRNHGLDGSDNGGAGGAGWRYGGVNPAYGGGGGAGNPGGTCYQASRNGKDGTGGLMILFVSGNIVITDTGSIQSHGSDGGTGEVGAYDRRYSSYAGSGSGGGAIHLFHKGSITGSELVTATGGSVTEGWLASNHSNGGTGTINIVQI